jgi:hypothetical protein
MADDGSTPARPTSEISAAFGAGHWHCQRAARSPAVFWCIGHVSPGPMCVQHSRSPGVAEAVPIRQSDIGATAQPMA